MNEIELYRKITENCDEALREAFLSRMEVAPQIARAKIENGMEVYSRENDEKSIERVCFGVKSDLKPQVVSLWRSLVRMNRGRQYRYFIENIPDYKLAYDDCVVDTLPQGRILGHRNIAPIAAAFLGTEVEAIPSTEAVIDGVLEGRAAFAAIVTDGFYDAKWLYTTILCKPIFVNAFFVLQDGRMLSLLSTKMEDSPENKIITVAFSIEMKQPGDMAQKVSVFAEAGMNIEYLTVKTQGIDDDDRRNINIVFMELSGGSLRSKETRTAFLQLEKECAFFRVLGCRRSV